MKVDVVKLFAVLGVKQNSTKSEIRNAYLRKVKELHPDSPTGSDQKFKELHEAYLQIKNLRFEGKVEEEDQSINFSSLVKNYSRAGTTQNTSRGFAREKRDQGSEEREEDNQKKSFYLHWGLYLFIFGTLYFVDSSDSSLKSFHSTYLSTCNSIQYTSTTSPTPINY